MEERQDPNEDQDPGEYRHGALVAGSEARSEGEDAYYYRQTTLTDYSELLSRDSHPRDTNIASSLPSNTTTDPSPS